jgi:hypothetical protein
LAKNTNPAKSRVGKRFHESKIVAVKDSQAGKTDRSTTPLVKEETKEKVNQEDNVPKKTMSWFYLLKIKNLSDFSILLITYIFELSNKTSWIHIIFLN